MRHRHIKRLAAAVLAATLAVATTGCGTQKEDAKAQSGETISIAYLPITHALALFEQAELQKDNPDYHIELIKYSSWSDLTDALNTGNVDGASVLIELAMKSEAQTGALTAVALGHSDGNVVVVSDDIQSAADLKGKTFAIPNTSSSHNILLQLLCQKDKLDVNSLNVVEMSPSEMPSALSSGQIAGYCVAEPFGAKAVTMHLGHVLYDSTELWQDSQCCALVLADQFIEENPELAKEFVHDYGDAGKKLTDDPDEAVRVASEYLDVDDTTLEQSLRWISYDHLEITKEAYETLSDYMVQYDILSDPPSYESFVNTDLLG